MWAMMQKFRTRCASVGTVAIVGGTLVTVIAAVFGGALVLIAIGLQVKADSVISRVTSRSFGGLAPGYAATRRGYPVYTALLATIGTALFGLGLDAWTSFGVWLFLAAVVIFALLSVVAIIGEVRTYRALKR